MDYKSFIEKVIEDSKLAGKHIIRLILVVFLTIGAIGGFILILTDAPGLKEGAIFAAMLNLAVYGAILYWLFPKFFNQFKSDIKERFK